MSELQHAAQYSFSADTKAIHSLNLPLALYVHIFTYFTVFELGLTLCVNKAFHDIAADGTLWKQQYRLHFPSHEAEMQTHLQMNMKQLEMQQTTTSFFPATSSTPPSESSDSSRNSVPCFGAINPAIQDWRTTFKQRCLLASEKFAAVVFDLGSNVTKVQRVRTEGEPLIGVGSKPSAQPGVPLHPAGSVLELDTIVAKIDGIHHLHMRQYQWRRAFVGASARERDPGNLRQVVMQGRVADFSILPEIFFAAILRLGVWSHRHPILLAEPPFGWSKESKERMGRELAMIFRFPGVAFASAALLALMSEQLTSGIAVSVGGETAWVAGVVQHMQVFVKSVPLKSHDWARALAEKCRRVPCSDAPPSLQTPRRQDTDSQRRAHWRRITGCEISCRIQDRD